MQILKHLFAVEKYKFLHIYATALLLHKKSTYHFAFGKSVNFKHIVFFIPCLQSRANF